MTLSTPSVSTPSGPVEFGRARSGRTLITLRPTLEAAREYIPRLSCETSHPEEVPVFLEHGVSFHWLCDTISRIEDPDYVLGATQHQLISLCRPHEFAGARVLDFGCGMGGSTLGMAALLPTSRIIGVELDAQRVRLARRLAQRRQLSNVAFAVSPAGGFTSAGLGIFQFHNA